MKIDYRETTSHLLKRIDIHEEYGARNIDEWMLETIPLKKGYKILDIGCGAGKQCFEYYETLEGDAEIIGTDISDELLSKANQVRDSKDVKIKFQLMDFNKPFPFENDTFDLVSCSFAIYYAEDIPFTISEMHRVLKPGGYLFTTGPMPENKLTFYEIIKKATQKTIPPMPGSSRYASEIFDSIDSLFTKTENIIFENPLTFPTADPFLEYTMASLSEDRKLWTQLFENKEEFTNIMKKIEETAEKMVKDEGKIVMTKVVGGFLAKK